MSNNSEKLLIQNGIFTGIMLGLFLFLSLFAVLSRKNWENALRVAVQDVLPPAEYAVEEKINVQNAPEDALCFKISRLQNGQRRRVGEGMALIVRVTTYYGPVPMVFVNEQNTTRFAGIPYMKSSIAKDFADDASNRQISFWIERAKLIFEAAQGTEGV